MRLAERLCLHALAHPPIARAIPVILNGGSGAGHGSEDMERLRLAFREAGLEARLSPFHPGEDPRDLARRALESGPPIIVAAGGDGTVSAVADVVRGTGTALAVMPVGTLNHFAKDLGIPLDAAEAARTVANGRRIAVDVGEVNGRCFVNNASLGLYPKIVQERNRQQRRFGRSKRTAMLWATLDVLDRSRLLDVRLELDAELRRYRAPFVFVGNNDYIMEGFDIGKRATLGQGMLKVYTTRRSSAGGLLALALRALFGRLRQADDFVELAVRSLRVESRRRRLLVAIDGEVTAMDTPLEFRIRPGALQVVAP
jgi:diacylglycerol kinase family enzyme